MADLIFSLRRAFAAVVLCSVAALASAAPAVAQTGTDPAAAPAAGSIPADLGGLIERIEDPDRRERLLADLKALKAAAGQATDPAAANGAGDQILGAVAVELQEARAAVIAVLQTLSNADGLADWLDGQVTSNRAHQFWRSLAEALAMVLAALTVAWWALARLFDGPLRRLRSREHATMTGRVVSVLGLALLETLPVLGTVGVGYAATSLTTPGVDAAAVTLSLVHAIALQMMVAAVARIVLSPKADQLRLIDMTGEQAAYLYIWIRRIVAVGSVGFFLHNSAASLGLPPELTAALNALVALVIGVLVIVLILQSRRAVAAHLRRAGRPAATPDEAAGTGTPEPGMTTQTAQSAADDEGGAAEQEAQEPPRDPVPVVGTLRRRLADIWHLLAIAYVAIGFVVFSVGTTDGFVTMAWGTAWTIAAVAGARLVGTAVDALVERLFQFDPELGALYHGLAERAGLYRNVLKRVLHTLIVVIALLLVFRGWGVDIVGALASETREAILGSGVTIAIVIVVSVLIWEALSASIERALSSERRQGRPVSNRARTLLPLLRRTVLIVLAVVAGLIMLSEIGVDIAPLLAGAGVLGLAIGFGSQALVRDIITGLFILIEDTMSVGDVVTAGGHTGVVEDLSIRTIRLRDLSGHLHTIPFGDVTTVVNMTKDFSYAVWDLGVAYREDTDHVVEVIKEVAAEFRRDREHRANIREDLEVLGLNQFGDSAVVIRVRMKVVPGKQWAIQREFNRRIKKAFDAAGIEIPFPHQTIFFGEDRAGRAPAANIRLHGPEAARPDQPATDVPPSGTGAVRSDQPAGTGEG